MTDNVVTIEHDPIKVEHQRQGDASKSTKEELIKFFHGTFFFTGIALVGLLTVSYLFYKALTFEPGQAWESFTLATAIPFFVVLLIAGKILSGLKQKIWSQAAYGLAWLVLLIGFFGSYGQGLSSWLRYTERCVNTGCGAEADYIPTYHGGVLKLKAGEAKTVRITAKVRVPVIICHKINANPAVNMSWTAPVVSNVYLEPLPSSGGSQVTTVTMVRAYDGKCATY